VELRQRVAPTSARRVISIDERVAALIAIPTAVVSAVLVREAAPVGRAVGQQPARLTALLGLTLLFQIFAVKVYRRFSVGVSAIPILASIFLANVGVAVSIAVAAALVQWLRTRGQLYKGLFDVGNFGLSAAAASVAFTLITPSRLLAAVIAGGVYVIVNNGLLSLAMSIAEGVGWRAIWSERFRWAHVHFALFGLVALVATVADEEAGIAGLAAVAAAPALMIAAMRQFGARTEAIGGTTADA